VQGLITLTNKESEYEDQEIRNMRRSRNSSHDMGIKDQYAVE
jgi:hypothetical protein